MPQAGSSLRTAASNRRNKNTKAAATSSSQRLKYPSRPLSQIWQEIRLFTLERDAEGVLHGRLEVFDLADCPPYVALSYTWSKFQHGTSQDSRGADCEDLSSQIILNGNPYLISPNLNTALHALIDRQEDVHELRQNERFLVDDAIIQAPIEDENFRSFYYRKEALGVYKLLQAMRGRIDRYRAREAARHELEAHHMFNRPFTYVCKIPPSGWTLFWVDAIYIDQSDDRERAHQVGLMGSLCRQASLVIGWLDPWWASTRMMRVSRQDRIECLKHWVYSSVKTRYPDGVSDEEARTYAQALLLNPYWTRMWIVQEVGLAQQYICLFGDVCIHDTFWHEKLSDRPTFEMNWWEGINETSNLPFRSVTAPRRQEGAITNWKFLTHHMKDFKSKECSDPRDKIYGMLGMMYTYPLEADYDITTLELFFRVMHIERDQDPEFLALNDIAEALGLGDSLLVTATLTWYFVKKRRTPNEELSECSEERISKWILETPEGYSQLLSRRWKSSELKRLRKVTGSSYWDLMKWNRFRPIDSTPILVGSGIPRMLEASLDAPDLEVLVELPA